KTGIDREKCDVPAPEAHYTLYARVRKGCNAVLDRKDDAEYVAALLRHGARVDDRRETVQMTDGGRATALHYAAKAGFVKTIEVLLDHGADSNFRDDNGLTPLDWLARASKSADRDAVRRLLHRVRERSPCFAIGDKDTRPATSRVKSLTMQTRICRVVCDP